MFLFLIHQIYSWNFFDNKTYVVSIWAGKETIRTRVMYQAKTWYRMWDEVIVYSDLFENGTCELVQRKAYPCHVKCITIGDYADHLEGTEWKHRWYFAQPRFLPAMSLSYENKPNADFYIFADDDTFLLKQSLLKKFKSRDSTLPKATGVKFCTWNKIAANIQPERSCHPFLQGGAGVILSHGLLSLVASELINCSKRFNDPDFAGSMRFAVCMERVFGFEKWSEGFFIESWSDGLHSMPPYYELPKLKAVEPPASFHRMNRSDFSWLTQKIYIDWKINNKKYRADLGNLAFIEYNIPFIKKQYIMKWCVGMWIELPFSKKRFKPKRKWIVLLDDDDIVVGYEHTYSNGMTMRLICDVNVEPDKIIPLDISGKDNTMIYLIYPLEVRCLTK
ncbi:hypothetical protein TRFO_21453 [Tritrichomonas foetus]|uniref:Uncharacterized protein n=1 Tax=Tritrichomonas foetus TaxID=1144522 RepID=A0A1J4KIX6_9EUKA|nr:hypothetical protein TRFO_21453 [Tritrichomonas foetus]|eukprot:OHT09638.1 hypothetical protein TRFO_21453 [Tritrichomonas foetus]